MQRSPRSISSSQSPIDDHGHEPGPGPGRAPSRRARPESSRSPPATSSTIRMSLGGGGPPLPPTTLPSIHNLQLPPPRHTPAASSAQQYSPSEFIPSGASYGHPSPFFAGTPRRSPALPSAYPPSTYTERRISFPPAGARPQPSTSAYPEQHASAPEAESDQEQNDSERGPPKKKRRRQALSCTECKRRKIKCDRTHPCGPCARRSEPEKCQWHVIEPVAHGVFRSANVSYSDKYVTRSEWDDLYARYRVLEERCIRLEKIILQLHPELSENPSYELPARQSSSMSSPQAPHLVTTRPYQFTGSGISGTSANPGVASQRVVPHTPVSALPGPSPRHGPGSAAPALPVGSSTGTEGTAASGRSGSAPPPMLTTRVAHRSPYSDRRTSASGSHASFAPPSERSVPHQVLAETVRGRPFTTPTSHSYTLPPPPPPPPENPSPPGYSPSRRHSYVQGRSAAVPDASGAGVSYATRLHGRSYPSPLSAVSTSRHMQLDDTAAAAQAAESMREREREELQSEYDRRDRVRDVAGRERGSPYERPEPSRMIPDTEPKNGEAQTSTADDALRYRPSAPSSSSSSSSSSPSGILESIFLPRQRTGCSGRACASAGGPPVLCRRNPGYAYAHSEGSAPPSPRIGSPELKVYAYSRKRRRSGGHYISLPSCGSAPETPPPAVVVH